MALRFEAWTLPWSGTFQRVVADIPAQPGSSGVVRLSDFGEASIDVHESYDRLDEIIADDTGSLIRVYDGTTIVQEFLAERVARNQQEKAGVVTISGPDLADVFNKTIVYPYDYPDNPSAFPDHLYGGENQLSNGDFEDGLGTNDVYEVWTDHTSGTFTLTIGGDTTDPLDYNATPIEVERALQQDISTVTDVSVSGTGDSDTDPWVITFFVPTQVTMTGDGSGLSGGSTFSVTETQSAESEAGAWTVSQGADQTIEPHIHGSGSISVVTTPVDSGTYALRITASSQFGGAQQVVAVEPGGIYQASIRIRSTSTGPFRFVIRDKYENLVAAYPSGGSGFTVTANTWTTVTISDVEIPAGVDAVVYRIAYVGTSTQTFYIDNAEFNEGLAASNVGEIVIALMDDAASDHSADTRGTPLSWIDYTGFDATNDSSSSAWSEDLSITAYATMTYGQFFDALVELGYEWRLTPKASPGATTHDLEWYISGNMGTDYTSAATPAINFGQATLGGPLVKRIPAYTRVLTLGAEGAFNESADATAVTNFGRLEAGRQDTAWANSTTLSAAATELLDLESRNRVAVQINVAATDDHPRPLVDYLPGDTLNFQIPPALARSGRRVRSIAWQHGEPATYQITGSRVFSGETGVYEAVRRLLREFRKPAPRAKGTVNLGGGTIPWLVAASDSSEAFKKVAGFQCDGTNDEEEINAAISTAEGEVWLAPGNYACESVAGSVAIDLGAGAFEGCRLWGMGGSYLPYIYQSDSGKSSPGALVKVDQYCTLENVAVATTDTDCVSVATGDNRVDSCLIEATGSSGSCITFASSTGRSAIIGNTFNTGGSNSAPAITVVGNNHLVSNNRVVVSGTSNAIVLSDAYSSVVSSNTIQDAATGIHVLGTGTSDNNSVTANTIDSCTIGVDADTGTGHNITGNVVIGPFQHGIRVDDVSNSIVTSNHVVEAGSDSSNTYDGIILLGNSDANHITDNQIVPRTTGNTTRYGINVSVSTCDNNAVVGNFLGDASAYGSGALNDAGTNTDTLYTGGAVGDNLAY